MSLVNEVGFASAYTFIYSKRPGTPAAEMVDDTPREVIQERFDRLAHLIEERSYASNQPELGQTVEVLVEGTSKKDSRVLSGHSPKNQTVHFALPDGYESCDLIGRMVDVHVDEARTWYLRGTAMGDPR